MTISEDEAREKAAYELRFEIGNLPHLGEVQYDSDEKKYIFPIKFTKPDIPEHGKDELEFYETVKIGEIIVKEDGTIERTSNEELNEAIREIDEMAKNGELKKR